MSFSMITAVFNSTLPPIPRLLMLAIADRVSDNGSEYFESRSTLARRTGCSVRTVERWMNWLVHEAHLLEMVRKPNPRRHHAAHYRIDLQVLASYRQPGQSGRPTPPPSTSPAAAAPSIGGMVPDSGLLPLPGIDLSRQRPRARAT